MEKKHKVLTILDYLNDEVLHCEHVAVDFSDSNEFEDFYLPVVAEYMGLNEDYDWHVVDDVRVHRSARLTRKLEELTDKRGKQCA